uniref:F5/8 type C domain-containing protein n=1 Tax=Macrostomum lignano TaxID=282301 RepID=A0A1I8I604_9PLAT
MSCTFYDNRADSAVTGRRCRVNGRLLTAGAGTSAAGAPVVLLGRRLANRQPLTVTALRLRGGSGAPSPEAPRRLRLRPGQLWRSWGWWRPARVPVRRSGVTESATVFSDSQSSSFDMDLYNSAVEITGEAAPACYYTPVDLMRLHVTGYRKRNRTTPFTSVLKLNTS